MQLAFEEMVRQLLQDTNIVDAYIAVVEFVRQLLQHTIGQAALAGQRADS